MAILKRASKREQRLARRGWVKYAPALALFFGAISYDAYVSNQLRTHDYILSQLKQQERELREQLSELSVESAALEDLDRLEKMSASLGLVDPGPRQVERLFFDGSTGELVPFAEGEVLATTRRRAAEGRFELAAVRQDTLAPEESPAAFAEIEAEALSPVVLEPDVLLRDAAEQSQGEMSRPSTPAQPRADETPEQMAQEAALDHSVEDLLESL